jgi:hypothetical protein
MTEYLPDKISIPAGLQPGDAPTGLTWPRHVWLVLPADPSSPQSRAIQLLRTKLLAYPDIQVFQAKIILTKGNDGRNYSLLPSNRVAGIYRGAHRARTAVIAFAGAQVLLDISELPSNRGCVSLEKFVEHKCAYALITRPEEVERVLTAVIAWMGTVICDGAGDPRCLPAAVFTTSQNYPLKTPQERRSFIDQHKATKKGTDLRDSAGRIWHIGPPHTVDLIQVAGQALPIGFHWDVQAGTKSSIITTGWERWELPGGSYTNIHPDAYIRGTKATKTHPPTSEKQHPKRPKTPRISRQQKRPK